ncbi:ZmpA/ZmpB/ZmpC family metallo-endopeptidase, partial [Streptococcus oricebi]
QQSAYTSQLSATKQVLDNQKASQAQVNQALQNLQAARASLQGQATNKSALQTEYNLKDSTQATSAYYNATSAQQSAYTSQLSATKQVLDNQKASQAQVNQALQNLQAARASLQGQATNKSALQTEYNLKDSTQATSAYYNATSAQQTAYTSQLSAVKQVLDNSQASQAQVDQALRSLQAARASLQGQATNKSALQTEYNLKDSLQKQGLYLNAQAAKKANYDRNLLAAKQVLDKAQASQTQVNQALSNLSQARTALDGINKTKPNLRIVNLTKDEINKRVTIDYRLEDPTGAYKGAQVKLYQEGKLSREFALTNPQGQLVLSDLDYYSPYRLVTDMAYSLDQGNFTSPAEASQDFDLAFKRIELKDIQKMELYSKQGSDYRPIYSLAERPSDLSKYFVKIQSKTMKDLLLPVAAIEEQDSDNYQVTATLEGLVQDRGQNYQENYSFSLAKDRDQGNVYTNFARLLEAMKQNLAGHFFLGADMSADDLQQDSADESYVTGVFTGSLTGVYNGKQHHIYGLKKPLFAQLKNSTIKDLSLQDVAISSETDTAALALKAENSKISNSHVAGNISLRGEQAASMAGLLLEGIDSQVVDSSFTGVLKASPTTEKKTANVGGLVANLKGANSLVERSWADLTIHSVTNNTGFRIGGLIGTLSNNARLLNSYVKGAINNNNNSGQVGGVIGSTYGGGGGRVDQVISDIHVERGFAITGDQGYKNASIRNAFALSGKKTRAADPFATANLSEQEAASKLASWQLTSNPAEAVTEAALDYLGQARAQADRRIAYENMQRLLPFYNKETIIAYGNQVAKDNKLYHSKLLSVLPMKDQEILTNLYGREREVNRLMLHFADNSLDYLDLSYQGAFQNPAISEYRIANSSLIYTPEQLTNSYQAILDKVLPSLQALQYDSAEIRQSLGLAEDADLSELYLADSYQEVQQNLARELGKVLAMDQAVIADSPAISDYLSQKISANKEAIMLGLSYLNRWYNINYDDLNIKDLASYKTDFFGESDKSPLDTIISLGQAGMDHLKSKNNYQTHERYLNKAHQKADLFDYLESLRQLFLPHKTNNEWFKTNTKAYVVEMKSNVAEARQLQDQAADKSKYSVGAYDKLTSPKWGEKGMLLPLLTMKEKGVYIISNLSTISFGSYERYRDADEKGQVRTGQDYYDYVEGLVDRTATFQRDHYDFWYKTLEPEFKDKLFRSVPVYDSFRFKDEQGQEYWSSQHDKRSKAIQNFFGPVGKWVNHAGNKNAYATGSMVQFEWAKLLEDYGSSVYTHEMTHNSDGGIYFEGFGRREGLGAELYARGLLQNTPNMSDATITLNTIFQDDPNSTSRLHAYNPTERFKNAEDLHEYVHGMFDMIYTLDYLEANSLLKQSDEVKSKWFNKIENYYVTEKDGRQTHAGNQIRQFTADEIKQLKTFESLIDNDVINRREYWVEKDVKNGIYSYKRNSYYSLSSLSPIYSALSNEKGAPGDIMFRRMAYELLAAKGYHEGFVPYVSNKFADQALAKGEVVWNDWYKKNLPLVSDKLVLENIFQGQYKTWGDFKKAMYQERIDQLANLKPITIEYELNQPKSQKKVTINSFAQLQEMMDAATAQDIKNIDRSTSKVETSWVNLLKKKVYNAYLRLTDDFRSSIFQKD